MQRTKKAVLKSTLAANTKSEQTVFDIINFCSKVQITKVPLYMEDKSGHFDDSV